MAKLEATSENPYKGFFVDLYVRCTNNVAIGMYEGMGYSVYRRVREYYGSLGGGKGGRDDEDAFGELTVLSGTITQRLSDISADMRKPLSRDPHRRSIRPNGRETIVGANDVS